MGGEPSRRLTKLAVLVKKIICIAKANGGAGVVRYEIDQGDKLVIWQANGSKLLPEDVYSRLEKP